MYIGHNMRPYMTYLPHFMQFQQQRAIPPHGSQSFRLEMLVTDQALLNSTKNNLKKLCPLPSHEVAGHQLEIYI